MDGTLYNIMLVVHIVAVALWLGSNIAMGLGSSRSEGASAEVNAWWADTQGFMGRTVKNAAFGLLFVTGVVMVIASDEVIKFSDPFVSVGFLAVIVGGALGGMVFAPGCRQISAAFRSGDESTAKATIHKLGSVGALESVVVVATIFFMVFQWGN